MSAIPAVNLLDVTQGASYITDHVRRYETDIARGSSRQLVDYYCWKILRAAEMALTGERQVQYDVVKTSLHGDTTYGRFDEQSFLAAWNEIAHLAQNGFGVDDGGTGSRTSSGTMGEALCRGT